MKMKADETKLVKRIEKNETTETSTDVKKQVTKEMKTGKSEEKKMEKKTATKKQAAKKNNKKSEENKTLTLEDRHKELLDIALEFNDASIKGDADGMSAAENTLKDALVIYNRELRYQEYEKFKKTGERSEIVKAALKQGEISQEKYAKKKESENAAEKIEFSTKNMIIDLLELDEYVRKTGGYMIFDNGQWIYKVEALAKTLTERIARDASEAVISSKIKQEYKISKEASEALNIKNPLSNRAIKAVCQDITNNVLGEGFTFTGKDLNYMLFTMTSQSNKTIATLTAATKKKVVRIFTHTLHRIVTNKKYDIEL